MGAMVMFSLLTMNVSRSMVMNTKELSKSEIEYNGIALVHSYLERAQWATEDELTRGHTDFIFQSTGKPSGCDFTKNDPCIETLELGSSGSREIDYYVYVEIQDNVSTPGSTDNKQVTVGVTSPYFYDQFDDTFSEYPIEIEFINSFE
jgi:hypothetical protein